MTYLYLKPRVHFCVLCKNMMQCSAGVCGNCAENVYLEQIGENTFKVVSEKDSSVYWYTNTSGTLLGCK